MIIDTLRNKYKPQPILTSNYSWSKKNIRKKYLPLWSSSKLVWGAFSLKFNLQEIEVTGLILLIQPHTLEEKKLVVLEM